MPLYLPYLVQRCTVSLFVIDLDAFFSPVGLDYDVDRLDYLLVSVRLTVDDYPVLDRLGPIDEHHVLLNSLFASLNTNFSDRRCGDPTMEVTHMSKLCGKSAP